MSATRIYNKILLFNEGSQTWYLQLWFDLAQRQGVQSISGEDSDFKLYVKNNKYLRFVNFDKTGTSTDNARKIYVGLWDDNETEILIYENKDSAYDPQNREYCICYSSEGDWTFHVGIGNDTKEDLSDVSPIFAVVTAIDPLTNDETWGIYVPYQHGGYANAYRNAATKYFFTDDTDSTIENKDGATNRAFMAINNANTDTAVLAPMAAIGSRFVSKYSYILLMGYRNENGSSTAGGKSIYWAVNVALPNT